MFATVRSISGSPRAYPVSDEIVRNDVLCIARTSSGPDRLVQNLQWRDVKKLCPKSTLVAANPCGRPVHLVLTRFGTRAVTYLVHTGSRSVDAIPLRFSTALHDRTTVARCTLCLGPRVLVVNEVSRRGRDEPIDRALSAHRLVHDDHVPDAALFPLRLVARRCFTLSQSTDLARFARVAGRTLYSISIMQKSAEARDFRISVAADGAPREETPRHSTSAPRQRGDPAPGTTFWAPVAAAAGPDAFKVRVGGAWVFVSVRTMAESALLNALDPMADNSCLVEWDGVGWRARDVRAGSGARRTLERH